MMPLTDLSSLASVIFPSNSNLVTLRSSNSTPVSAHVFEVHSAYFIAAGSSLARKPTNFGLMLRSLMSSLIWFLHVRSILVSICSPLIHYTTYLKEAETFEARMVLQDMLNDAVKAVERRWDERRRGVSGKFGDAFKSGEFRYEKQSKWPIKDMSLSLY